jgi:hypothetical protein
MRLLHISPRRAQEHLPGHMTENISAIWATANAAILFVASSLLKRHPALAATSAMQDPSNNITPPIGSIKQARVSTIIAITEAANFKARFDVIAIELGWG